MTAPATTPPHAPDSPADAPAGAVRIVAHRGDSEAARENTLAAVVAAVEAGADAVEVDVRTSADGVSMVIHDATTLRLWGRPQQVADQTAAQLAELGTGAPGEGLDAVRIPRLTEVVDVLAGLERPPALLVDCVLAADATTAWTTLRTHPAVSEGKVRVEWCGDLEAMRAVRALDPQAVVQYAHPGGALDVAAVEALGAGTVTLEWVDLTPSLVDEAHVRGWQVAVWTLNSAEQMSWAIDAGVDAITTDRPRLLRPLATEGCSPLALAWADHRELAARLGVEPEVARWVTVARDLAEWTIHHTRTAPLGSIETKKHAADVVTAVDRQVEEHIRAVIAAEFPDHLVVGEEMGGTAEPGHAVWWVDPVDGTTNLANHIPWTSLSLALAIGGEPVVAVVAQPWTGEIYLAARGFGAVLNGRPLQLARVDSLAGRAVMLEMDAASFWPGQPEFMARLGEAHCTPRIMGSGTLTMARIASGDAVGGLVHAFHPIDHLAGVLIAHEAGARVLNEDGGDSLCPLGGGMLVAAPGAAEKLWPIWQPQPWS